MAENGSKLCPVCGAPLILGLVINGIVNYVVHEHEASGLYCEGCWHEEELPPKSEPPKQGEVSTP